MSTYLSLHYNLVFSTKRREPRIAESWMARFHEYLGGTVNGLGGVPQGVCGVADPVHLLVGLKATHCLSDFMRELKKASLVWVHDVIGDRAFGWQEGYAAFTVSATSRSGVQSYIANQAAHHHQKSFRDELIELLRKAEVEFDERYLDGTEELRHIHPAMEATSRSWHPFGVQSPCGDRIPGVSLRSTPG